MVRILVMNVMVDETGLTGLQFTLVLGLAGLQFTLVVSGLCFKSAIECSLLEPKMHHFYLRKYVKN